MTVYDDAREALADVIDLTGSARLHLTALDVAEAAEKRGCVYGRSNTDYAPPSAHFSAQPPEQQADLAVVSNDPTHAAVTGEPGALREIRRARTNAHREIDKAAEALTTAFAYIGVGRLVRPAALVEEADTLRTRLDQLEEHTARQVSRCATLARRALCSAIGTVEKAISAPNKPDGAATPDNPRYCRSCLRIGYHSQRGDKKHVPQHVPLCTWCYGVRQDYGRWPTPAAVELHAQGRRLSQQAIDTAMGVTVKKARAS